MIRVVERDIDRVGDNVQSIQPNDGDHGDAVGELALVDFAMPDFASPSTQHKHGH